jgi:hypothetical protein
MILILVNISSANCLPSKEWIREIGEQSYDRYYINDLIKTSGSTITLTGFNIQTGGVGGMWLYKVDDQGNMILNKTLGDIGDLGLFIFENQDKSFFVIGYRDNNMEIVILKINSMGEIIWEKTLIEDYYDLNGYSKYEGLIDCNRCSDNSLILISKKVKATEKNSYTVIDLKRITVNGEIQWSQELNPFTDTFITYDNETIENWGSVEPISVLETKDGGFLITGLTSSYLISDGKSVHVVESWIVKTNDSGNIQWDTFYNESRFIDVVQKKDGEYICCVYGMIDIIRSFGIYFLIITDEGNIEEITIFEPLDNNDEVIDFIQNQNDGYLIIGNTHEESRSTLGNRNEVNDYFIMKINEDYEMICVEINGSKGLIDKCTKIIELNNDCYIFSGNSRIESSSDNKAFIIKYGNSLIEDNDIFNTQPGFEIILVFCAIFLIIKLIRLKVIK